MITLTVGLLASTIATYLLVRYSHLHSSLTADSSVGPQKFHSYPVSRAGGVAIIAAFAATPVMSFLFGLPGFGSRSALWHTALLFLCAAPAFAGGFAEDITKRVGVGARLAATMLAAGLAYFALDGVLDRIDVAGLDAALRYGFVSLAFTMIAVGGIANAINIVDGYNGLASMISALIFGALAYVAWIVGDAQLVSLSLLMCGAVLGFLIWNFPRGAIFLGDGGAYFIGFMIGEISVQLVRRHVEVSPWFPLMLVAYPVWETLFSIYRKKLLRGQSPGEADGLHFHQLVYKRVMRWKVGSKDPVDRCERNSLTSPYLWAFAMTTIIPAVLFWDSSVILGFSAFTFAFCYIWLYRRMVTFRVPRWLIVRRSRTKRWEEVLPAELEASETSDYS